MNSKILILAFVACYQVATAQFPTGFPNPLNIGGFPSLLGGGGGAGAGSFNSNWIRPYYTAAADGWRTYFEQLQQARNQLYQTLTNVQNTAQNATGTARDTLTQILSAMPIHTKHIDDDETQPQILGDLQTPAVEAPAQQDVPKEIQVVHTVTRPQVQSDVPHVRPQGQVSVTHTITQSQPNARQPQTQTNARQPQNTATHQTVNTATRPATSQVTSGAVPLVGQQMVPQVGTQMVPQVGSQIVPQVPGQLVPQEGFQWVGK